MQRFYKRKGMIIMNTIKSGVCGFGRLTQEVNK